MSMLRQWCQFPHIIWRGTALPEHPRWSVASFAFRPQYGHLTGLIRMARSYASSNVKSRIATDDTIYAVSTAPGRSAIAIIRISGSACMDVSEKSYN